MQAPLFHSEQYIYIYILTYFENLTIGLHVLYVLNTHIKFCSNRILFIIQFINLFFMHNLILQKN